MATQMHSPTQMEPPPAPKARQGLLKSFQGSMLLLVTKHESFETVDLERRSQEKSSGTTTNRGSSLFRASDLFSQGRSSASSFGSRGSFSNLFPARPSSAPIDPNSREPSPATSPRTSLSREDQEGSGGGGELRHSLSSTMVSALKKTKGDFSRKIRGTFNKASSNLGIKNTQEQQQQQQAKGSRSEPKTNSAPELVNLPSYVKVSKPQTHQEPQQQSHRAEQQETKPSVVEPAAAATAAATATTSRVSPPSKTETRTAALSPPSQQPKTVTLDTVSFSSGGVKAANEAAHQKKSESETTAAAAAASEEVFDDNDGATRNILLRAADLETISVLAARIGDRAAARAVVRISRSAEAFARGEASSCLEMRDMIKCRDPPALRYCFDEQGELIDGEREEDEYECCTDKFYGEKRPKIALDRYLGRLVRYLDSFSECGCGVDSMGVLALVGGAILVDRLSLKRDFVLDSMNTHRVFMVAALIALKVLDDEPCSNEYYANVGGVEMAELNALEVHMLKALDYDVTIHAFELKAALMQFIGPKATLSMFNQWFDC